MVGGGDPLPGYDRTSEDHQMTIRRLESENAGALSELHSLRLRDGQQAQELAELRQCAASANELQDEVFRLQSLVKQLEVEASQLFSDKKMQKEAARAREQKLRDDMDEERQARQQRVRELEADVVAKNQQLQRAEAEMQQRRSADEDEARQLREQEKLLRTQLEEARQEAGSLRMAVDQQRDGKQLAEKALEDLTALNEQLQKDRAAQDEQLRAAVAGLEGQLAEQRKAAETRQAEVEQRSEREQEQQRRELEAVREELRAAVREAEERVVRATANLATLEEERNRACADAEQQRSERTRSEQIACELQEQLEAQRAENEELKKRIAEQQQLKAQPNNAEVLLAKLVEVQTKMGQTSLQLAEKMDATTKRMDVLGAQQQEALHLKEAEELRRQTQEQYTRFLDQFEEVLAECDDI